jgi:hypothetical protein
MTLPCDECAVARGWPAHNTFNPACLYCGARYIRHLGTLRTSAADIAVRRRGVLDVWKKHGHDEAQLRALAKGEHIPFEPITKPAKAKGRGKA